MTIRQHIRQYLEQCGMFPDQIDAVIAMILRPELKGGLHQMAHRIDDDMSDYPVSLRAVMLVAVKRIALEYCEAHAPKAWFKPLFMNDVSEGRG